MCQIMENDDDLIALAKQQQAELKTEIQKVGHELTTLKELAASASADARSVAESIIAPQAKTLIWWVKGFLAVVGTTSTLVMSVAVMWLNANYLNLKTYNEEKREREVSFESSRKSQLGFNEKIVGQLNAVELAIGLNNQSSQDARRSLDDMRGDIRELRRDLKR